MRGNYKINRFFDDIKITIDVYESFMSYNHLEDDDLDLCKRIEQSLDRYELNKQDFFFKLKEKFDNMIHKFSFLNEDDKNLLERILVKYDPFKPEIKDIDILNNVMLYGESYLDEHELDNAKINCKVSPRFKYFYNQALIFYENVMKEDI